MDLGKGQLIKYENNFSGSKIVFPFFGYGKHIFILALFFLKKID